jgi:hypothetical protein
MLVFVARVRCSVSHSGALVTVLDVPTVDLSAYGHPEGIHDKIGQDPPVPVSAADTSVAAD